MGRIPIDLVMSGSGCRLSAHGGALYALYESGKFQVERVAGTSGGAVVGSAVAVWGMDEYSVEKIKMLCINTDFEKLIKDNKFFRLIRLFRKSGIYEGKKFERFVDKEIYDGQLSQFENLHIVTADLFRKEAVVLNSRTFPTLKLSKALRRSLSIPYILTPNYRKINGVQRCFVDGGIANNYPIDIFDDNERPTIGINLVGQTKPMLEKYKLNVFELSMSILDCLMACVERQHLKQARYALTIEINTGDVSSFDFNITKSTKQWLFRQGYEQTKEWIKKQDFELLAKNYKEQIFDKKKIKNEKD